MAKQAADTSIGPNTYGVGLGIFATGIETPAELRHYVVGQITTTYWSFTSDPDFGSADLQAHDTWTNGTSSPLILYQKRIWIDPDVQNLRVYSAAFLETDEEVEIEYDIGGTTEVHTLGSASHAADDFDQATSVDVSALSGYRIVTITMTQTVGTSDTSRLTSTRGESFYVVATDLPDPEP